MGRTPDSGAASPGRDRPIAAANSTVCLVLVAAAAVVGLALVYDTIGRSSATYDETAYLRVAARWWRTGEQTEITRMGSPLTFWKLQQVPVFWVLDRLGRGNLIDEPTRDQPILLPLVRAGALWIWLSALLLCAGWSRALYGPRAMALAAWLFVLSPNLLAHAGLVTMELPLLATTTAMLFLFWKFLVSGRWGWLAVSALVGGLAFSCKSTAILFPPIMAVAWLWVERRRGHGKTLARATGRVLLGMAAYTVILLTADAAATGFAMLPLSGARGNHPSIPARFGARFAPLLTQLYETPVPQDWVGFATQVHHQLSGGPSYLLGERRMTGWRSYYLIALAVKVPLSFWLLLTGRMALEWKVPRVSEASTSVAADCLLPLTIGLFLTIASLGSTRNYGFRYLLPLAPLAIIWISRLAEEVRLPRFAGIGWPGWVAGLGLAGQALAVAAIHPFELTYFNVLAGGPVGGRRILADSNLDWGQGLKGLARLQRERPELRDLTLYYFGDVDPAVYGVQGVIHRIDAVNDRKDLPPLDRTSTRYLAVSASLQWGPWGPAGFFSELNSRSLAFLTEDTTIAVYRYEADQVPGAAK